MGALILAGVGLCVIAAVPAFTRLGFGQGATFVVVGLALTALAVGVLRGVRWAVVVSLVVGAGQLVAIVGTVWELIRGIDGVKASQLRRLGFDPTVGVAINLSYSAMAATLFGWFAVRWWRARRQQDSPAR
jgi:hypothetical protein